MKALLFLVIFHFCMNGMAQKPGDKIPPFKLVLSNGSFFSAEDVKKNRPVVLIYFAPDCGHCKTLMSAFFKRVTDFAKAEVIMITYKPLKEVAAFIREYRIMNFQNITVGTEIPTYFTRYYFNLSNTPFTALYNKRKEFVYSYRKETLVADLVNRLNGIK